MATNAAPATDVSTLGTILGVWAHPDDETYVMAGIMALAVRAGQRLVCVTATRGEEGSQDHARWPPSEMARIRTRELEESLAVLGVGEHHWLDYRDGTCAEVPHDEGVARLVPIVEEVQPTTILTFGPDGGTGHLDHIAVSQWTTAAFEKAAPRGSRLHYETTTPEWMERFGSRLAPYNVWAPGTPTLTSTDSLSIDVELDDDILDLKLRALAKQASQTSGLSSAFDPGFWRQGNASETFYLAAFKS